MKQHQAGTFLLSLATLFAWVSSASGDVVINEIMYNPDALLGPDDDYEWVELYNTGSTSVNLSGWKLWDTNPLNEPFIVPSNTVLEAGEYLVICSNLGFVYITYGITNVIGNFGDKFGLGNGDDTVVLLNASGNEIDRVAYNDAYPWPFQPDGGGPSLERINPLAPSNAPHNWAPSVPLSDYGTPGRQNSLFSDGSPSPVVITEIHYHPASSSEEDEYVELYNTSSSPASLGGWQFTNGFSFTFASGTTLGPFEYLAVCKNTERARTIFGIENVVGDFELDSSLSNGGETIVLRDNTGRLVDFVPFSDEAYWPTAADGYGPSIECINPAVPNHDPANWTAGDVTRNWVYFETAPGIPTGEVLYFYLNDEGEALLDDISLVPEEGGENLIGNAGFESGDAEWLRLGNHSTSGRAQTDAHSGTAAMRIISTGDGGGGDWRNYIGLPLAGLSPEKRYVLSFWAKPLQGETRLVARLANSRSTEGVYVLADLADGGMVCSPGRENAAHSQNTPPFIFRVRHTLYAPDPGSPSLLAAKITARVVDFRPDGSLSSESISSVMLEYRVDDVWVPADMFDDGLHDDGLAGDGEFGAEIPAKPCFTLVRYRIAASDTEGAASISPGADAMNPTHAYFTLTATCYDPSTVPGIPVYTLLVSEESLQTLQELGSRDDYVHGTFVFDGYVYDNVGVRWYGSFSERIATKKKNWRIKFNSWEKLNGRDSLILLGGDSPDPGLRGSVGLREYLSQNIFRFGACAYSATRHVRLEVNGSYYGLMLEIERPDEDYLERNNRDRGGDLFQARSLPGQPPSNMSVLSAYDEYAFAYDKKTNRLQPHDGLISLIEGIQNLEAATETEVEQFFNANLDVPRYASYLSAVALTQDWQSPSRDYYLFYGENPLASGDYLWELIPWGGEHNWEQPALPVLNGTVGQNVYSVPDMMRTRFLNTPGLLTTFADRLRYLLDTTWTDIHLVSILDVLQARIGVSAEYDRAHWWPEATPFASHVAAVKANILARREFLYRWLDGIEGPAQPVNISPPHGSRYLLWPVTLVASPFSGAGAHEASQWQLREDGGWYDPPLWDSGEQVLDKTSIAVPSPDGPTEGPFFWRVRYKDNSGGWSPWSHETVFMVEEDTSPPAILAVRYSPETDDVLQVFFDEPVEISSAETTSNYWINGLDAPLSASLSADGLVVTLTISPGSALNWLSVSNISDRAPSPNVIPPDTWATIEHLSADETKINFQPSEEPIPPGYIEDSGEAFSEQRGYGWATDSSGLAAVRGLSADPRLDTLVQFGGEGSFWEISLPSPARYRVTLSLGDAASESIYDLSAEGAWLVAERYVPAGEFHSVTSDVDVTDGHLTLYGGDTYKGTRINYLHVLPIYLDADGDFIDDVWETTYFGSVEACDPGADPDGDGESNSEEYLAGTNPLAFPFKVNRLIPNSSDPDWLDVTWTHSPLSEGYVIEWSETPGSWISFTPAPPDMVIDPGSGTVTWTDKGTAPGMEGLPPGQVRKRFYRVKTLQP